MGSSPQPTWTKVELSITRNRHDHTRRGAEKRSESERRHTRSAPRPLWPTLHTCTAPNSTRHYMSVAKSTSTSRQSPILKVSPPLRLAYALLCFMYKTQGRRRLCSLPCDPQRGRVCNLPYYPQRGRVVVLGRNVLSSLYGTTLLAVRGERLRVPPLKEAPSPGELIHAFLWQGKSLCDLLLM